MLVLAGDVERGAAAVVGDVAVVVLQFLVENLADLHAAVVRGAVQQREAAFVPRRRLHADLKRRRVGPGCVSHARTVVAPCCSGHVRMREMLTKLPS